MRSPARGSAEWDSVRCPILQLLLAPPLTFIAIAATLNLTRRALPLIAVFAPTTTLALIFHRRAGIVLMWPLMALSSYLIAFAALFWAFAFSY